MSNSNNSVDTFELFLKRTMELMERNRIVVSGISQETEPRRFASFVVAAICRGARTVLAIAMGFACGNLFEAVELVREVKCVTETYTIDWLVASKSDGSGVKCVAMGIANKK